MSKYAPTVERQKLRDPTNFKKRRDIRRGVDVMRACSRVGQAKLRECRTKKSTSKSGKHADAAYSLHPTPFGSIDALLSEAQGGGREREGGTKRERAKEKESGRERKRRIGSQRDAQT